MAIETVSCMPAEIWVLPIHGRYFHRVHTSQLFRVTIFEALVIPPHPVEQTYAQEEHSNGGSKV